MFESAFQSPKTNQKSPPLNLSISNQRIGYGTIKMERKPMGLKDVFADPKSNVSSRPFRVQIKEILRYAWPKKSFLLQLIVFLCFLLLLAGRVINLFIPIYSKHIVDKLGMTVVKEANHDSHHHHHHHHHHSNHPTLWRYVFIWLGLKALQGGVGGTSGLLNNLTSYLWIYVQQYTEREVEVSFFAHLHSLSSRWHYERQTGTVLRALDRGTEAINDILQYFIFNILPTIFDVGIAIVYFASAFDYTFALLIVFTLLLYFFGTHYFSKWRMRYNRTMNSFENQKRQRGVDALLNSDTVKDFVNEDYERDCYGDALQSFQREEVKFTVFGVAIDLTQTLVLTAGLGIGCCICVEMVLKSFGKLTVGDYVLFSTYMLQLFEPLGNMGQIYKLVLRRLVNMENMFDVFRIQPEIIDSPFARPYQLTRGEVEFKNVYFGYTPDRMVLNNISFRIPPGHTMAIVGPSGGGKTSVTRLLMRLCEVSSGEILVDGRSIKSIKFTSLRSQIGIVPQDTVLFNTTIGFNINYGRKNATHNEVIEAAKVAHIHDRIMSFPETYETVVGERGLKLSGGEKQRVAVARVVLKNPSIIVLDEATSSLDTKTERSIQSALKVLCQNRTCLIVAHRLSTIVDANTILVLQAGKIIETGTHTQLMAFNGVYASMWEAQRQRVEEEEIVDQELNHQEQDS